MDIVKSLKPSGNYFSTAVNYGSENLILYALILYTITGNNDVLLFVFGIVINALMYFILKNNDYYDGKTFPSIGMQTLCFLYAFVITRKLLDNNLEDTNPLFYLIGLGMFYFIWANDDNTFPALVVGAFVGASVGIIYSWLIYEYVDKEKIDNIKLFGAPYSDYNQCETIDEENLPTVEVKERTKQSTCV